MFKNLGNLASLMKQATQIQGKMGEATEELKSKRVTGSAGGGLVEVEADGAGTVLKVTIDPVLIENQDAEMIQDLLPAAFNSASQKAKQLHMEMMQEMTGGIQIPGMDIDSALQDLMGGNPDSDSPESDDK